MWQRIPARVDKGENEVLLREKLVQYEFAAAKLGSRELGNDHGLRVKKFLEAVDLPKDTVQSVLARDREVEKSS
jgi:hypothetical protein